MNLKDFLANREHPKELFWSLIIEENCIQAGIWYIGDKTAEVLSISPPTVWETQEELVGAVDAALSSAIQKLPEDYKEPDKTVFGVSSSWVKGGEIEESRLSTIKQLCTELSLSPVGFVVLPEAIAHLYKSEEGSPLNAVIVGLSKGNLEISVFKLGNLIGTSQVSRSVSLVEDIVEGLSRFEGAAPLPSRFIIYDGKEGELEEAKETLMQAPWVDGDKVKFLHTPKAEVLTTDRKVLATSLAGASEMGDVTQVASHDEKEVDETEEPSPVQEKEIPTENVDAKDLGFVVGEDVSTQTPDIVNVAPVQQPTFVEKPKTGFNAAKFAGAYATKAKGLFHFFSDKLPTGNKLPGIPKKNTWIMGAVAGISLIIAGLLYYWFVPSAKIIVYVTPKRFEQQTKVTFSANGQSDIASGMIPAEVVSDVASGEKTKSTSGVKLIGDKAKGSVQIANGNSTAINLTAGTFLVSATGLKFGTISQASVSGQLLPGSPGMATVDVVANDIGAQYNLAKGEVFSVGNYSKALVAATSISDFSGGSSREVSAVSKDDQANLEKALKDEITQSLLESVAEKVSTEQYFINSLAEVIVKNQVFDHKVGDSFDSLKLSLTLEANGLAADKAKLLQYAASVLKDSVPPGYGLNSDQVDFKFTFVEKEDDNYVYNVTIGANFLPQVDTNKIKGQIMGKTPDAAEKSLNTVPGFVRAAITFKPNLLPFLKMIPRVGSHISLEVLPEL